MDNKEINIGTNTVENTDIDFQSLSKKAYTLLFDEDTKGLKALLDHTVQQPSFTSAPIEFLTEFSLLYYFQEIDNDKFIEIIDSLDNQTRELKAESLLIKALILAKKGQKEHLKYYLESQSLIHKNESKQTTYLVVLCNYLFFTNKHAAYYKLVETELIPHPIYTNTHLDLDIYNALGVYYGMHGELTNAFEMFYNIYLEAKEHNFKTKIAIAQTNLATIEAKLFNYESALIMYQEILIKYSDILDDSRKTYIINNIAHLELQNNNTDKAVEILSKLKLENIPDKSPFYELTICQLARVNILDKNTLNAHKYLEKYNQFTGTKHHESIHFLNRALLAQSEKDELKSKEWALKSKNKCIEVQNNDGLMEALLLLKNMYASHKQSKEYSQILEEIVALKDKFLILQKRGQNTDIKIKTLLIEKEVKIKALEQEAKHNALMLEKNKEIEKTNNRLQEKVNELKTFAYIISHDLKEPMRMITSFSNLLKKENQRLAGKSKEYLNFISTGTQRMNDLLDGLYKYTSLSARRNKTIEPIDLNKIIFSVLQNLKMSIQEKKAQVHYNNLPIILSNHILLIQLIQNIISNAIKFTKQDLSPIINIDYIDTGINHEIHISDNGIGISKENIDDIFEVFRMLNTKEEYSGTGIGLSICKKIVQYLEGDVHVESTLGKGTTFILNLPYNKHLSS